MKEVHISAFDSWQKFDHNTCEATGSQREFPDDMFDTYKRRKVFSFHLAIFEIEDTGYF